MVKFVTRHAADLVAFSAMITSFLMYLIITRTINLDPDTGNLLTAVKRHGYLSDLLPNFSFSSSLESLTWFMHRALDFDVSQMQWVSSLIIGVFVLLCGSLIRRITSNRAFAIFSTIAMFSLFTALQGYGNWALITYPLSILMPLLAFVAISKLYIDGMSFPRVGVAAILVILAVTIDVRFLLPLCATIGAVLLAPIDIRRFSTEIVLREFLNRKFAILCMISLGILGLATALITSGSALHQEAFRPRQAIHWNYYGEQYGNSNFFSYLQVNFFRLIQSAFLSENVISDTISLNWKTSTLLFITIVIGWISCVRSEEPIRRALAYYCTFCLVMAAALGVLGLYAFGNVRYQMWIIFGFYVLFFVGLLTLIRLSLRVDILAKLVTWSASEKLAHSLS